MIVHPMSRCNCEQCTIAQEMGAAGSDPNLPSKVIASLSLKCVTPKYTCCRVSFSSRSELLANSNPIFPEGRCLRSTKRSSPILSPQCMVLMPVNIAKNKAPPGYPAKTRCGAVNDKGDATMYTALLATLLSRLEVSATPCGDGLGSGPHGLPGSRRVSAPRSPVLKVKRKSSNVSIIMLRKVSFRQHVCLEWLRLVDDEFGECVRA